MSPAFLQRGQASTGTCHQPPAWHCQGAQECRSGSALTPLHTLTSWEYPIAATLPWGQENSRAGDPLDPYKSLLQLSFQSFAESLDGTARPGMELLGCLCRSWIPLSLWIPPNSRYSMILGFCQGCFTQVKKCSCHGGNCIFGIKLPQ